MPRYEIELRQWVQYCTMEYVDAESASEARAIVDRHNSFWERTGNCKPATVHSVRVATTPAGSADR